MSELNECRIPLENAIGTRLYDCFEAKCAKERIDARVFRLRG